jgi:methanogenic corrinoid protein MtbC1
MGSDNQDQPELANSGPETLTLMPREQRTALLARIVRSEILPRLAQTHATPLTAVPPVADTGSTTEGDTRALVGLLLTHPAIDAVAFVESLRSRGVSAATLYLGVITDAARQLGILWTDDRCSFADVTIGLGHLQQVVRALSPTFQISALSHAHPDTVLLVPAPGETHTLGLVVLSEFFRREGWHVAGGPRTTAGDAVNLTRDSWVDVAGFSIGSEHLLEGLKACIATIRTSSLNQAICVMVGGPLLLTYPDLARRAGADSAATDAASAVREASALLSFRIAAD